MIEGDEAGSVTPSPASSPPPFSDPEGLFYLTRHLARFNQATPAIELFERVVGGGFFCYPAMSSDPWLSPFERRLSLQGCSREPGVRA